MLGLGDLLHGILIPSPIDNKNYLSHVKILWFLVRELPKMSIKDLEESWLEARNSYEMYRHDYGLDNPSPQTNSSRLYDANYYVINSDFRVYVCIDNGSSEANTTGNFSQDEPTFVDLEPSRAGESGDGYIWKYLFTVSPSDIIKFDSIEYIPIPNDWETTTDQQIVSVRDNGDSTINENQIKKIYVEKQGLVIILQMLN